MLSQVFIWALRSPQWIYPHSALVSWALVRFLLHRRRTGPGDWNQLFAAPRSLNLLNWDLYPPDRSSPCSPHLLPRGTAGNSLWSIPNSLLYQPAPHQHGPLPQAAQEASPHGHSLLTQSTEHPAARPADPAAHCSAPPAAQPRSTTSSNTRVFVLRLQSQDKHAAKLGANCNTTDFGSQPSFHLLRYFCPNFPPSSPSFRYFWADHNTTKKRQMATWLRACPREIKASPHSLLSHSSQHHFITAKAEKPVAAVSLSNPKANWETRI